MKKIIAILSIVLLISTLNSCTKVKGVWEFFNEDWGNYYAVEEDENYSTEKSNRFFHPNTAASELGYTQPRPDKDGFLSPGGDYVPGKYGEFWDNHVSRGGTSSSGFPTNPNSTSGSGTSGTGTNTGAGSTCQPWQTAYGACLDDNGNPGIKWRQCRISVTSNSVTYRVEFQKLNNGIDANYYNTDIKLAVEGQVVATMSPSSFNSSGFSMTETTIQYYNEGEYPLYVDVTCPKIW